jgi:hypothetical protein
MRICFSFVIRAPSGHCEPSASPICIFDFNKDNFGPFSITFLVKIQCTPSAIFSRPKEKIRLYLDANLPSR